MRPVPGLEGSADADGPLPADPADRWDGASVHEWSGTYGDYLRAKVAKVFPALAGELG